MKFILAAVPLLMVVSSVRQAGKISPHSIADPTAGSIAGAWLFASPAVSREPIRNPLAESGCFPGARFWASGVKTSRPWWGGRPRIEPVVDIVTRTTPGKSRHAFIEAVEFNGTQTKVWPCDAEVPDRPSESSAKGTWELHDLNPYYAPNSAAMSDLLYDITNVGILESYAADFDALKARVAQYGWSVIGSVKNNDLYKQVAHGFKKDNTGICVLTFQGSKSAGDWVANANGKLGDFCGLNVQVHSGFRDVLRAMTQGDGWHNKIHPHLSSCTEVHVTGHSLGGATSQLFAACANQQLKEGAPGYDDYKYIGWNMNV